MTFLTTDIDKASIAPVNIGPFERRALPSIFTSRDSLHAMVSVHPSAIQPFQK
ncbi:hypothetical protein LZC95_37275 [Pendulispora brunnea]|uniref:Uncharacterized protein n=1 Tax=Pendulispora brunnea TaxID=2905690 RepID=A0ABZ2K4E6_9BACT